MQKQIVYLVLVLLLIGSSPILAQDTINMEFQQAPLTEVFQIIGQLGGYNVLVDPTVKGEVSFTLKNLPIEEALDLVTKTTGYRYTFVGNTLIVGSDQRLKTEFGQQDFTFISLKNVAVQDGQELVRLLVPEVKTYVDQEQKLLVLFGLTNDLDFAKQILRQYDQTGPASVHVQVGTVEPQSEVETDLSLRAWPIYYAEPEEVLERVRQSFPFREFRFDEQTRNIVAETTATEWQSISALVADADVPKFILRGLLSTAQGQLALVEYQGAVSLVEEQDYIADWQVLVISQGSVEFANDQRSFTVRMGR